MHGALWAQSLFLSSPPLASLYSQLADHTTVPMPIFQMGILRLRGLTQSMALSLPSGWVSSYFLSVPLLLRF